MIRRSQSGGRLGEIAVTRTIGDDEANVLDTWAKKENETATAERNKELEEELNPRKHRLHRFFNLVSFITVGCAFNMLVSQILGVMFEGIGPIQYVLRLYVVMFCVVVVLNELEWTKFTRESMLLNLWISRGILYTFIGVLGLEENNVSPENKNTTFPGRQVALNYVIVVAWMMVACGALYFLMGLSCLQIVSNKMRTNYKERVERSQETARLAERFNIA